MTVGIVLDICGVVILAGPLLRLKLGDLTYWRGTATSARSREMDKFFAKMRYEYDGTPIPKHLYNTHNFLNDKEEILTHLQVVYDELLEIKKEKHTHRKTAIIALIIITAGFSLQIVANVMK